MVVSFRWLSKPYYKRQDCVIVISESVRGMFDKEVASVSCMIIMLCAQRLGLLQVYMQVKSMISGLLIYYIEKKLVLSSQKICCAPWEPIVALCLSSKVDNQLQFAYTSLQQPSNRQYETKSKQNHYAPISFRFEPNLTKRIMTIF